MKSLSHAKYAKHAKASINREKNPEESFLGDLGDLERAIASGRERRLCLHWVAKNAGKTCVCVACAACLPRFTCELWKVLTNAECGMRNAECGMRNAECGTKNES